MRRMSRSIVSSAAGLLAVLVAGAWRPATAQQATAQQAARTAAATTDPESLYQRLGGVYPISAVVDDFIDRLLVNDVLNANPAINAARSRVPAAGLKFHVTGLVCAVTGGPCQYSGRDMKSSHAHLGISSREWQAMLADFKATLDRFSVPARERQELIAILESTRGDIVVRE